MKYYEIEGGTDYCGTDFTEYIAVDDNENILGIMEDMAVQNAEGYEYMCEIGMDEEDYDTEEDFETALEDAHDEFWGGIWGRVREITKEEFEEATA